MTARWPERKLDDDLLKRELLLRLRAEHFAVPGRSRPATDYFRRRVRRLMLRHPLFAFKYYLLALDLGLGRFEARGRDHRRGSETLMLALAQQRRLLPARRVRARRAVRRIVGALGWTLSELVGNLRRGRTVLQARLPRPFRQRRYMNTRLAARLERASRTALATRAATMIREQRPPRRPPRHAHAVAGVPAAGVVLVAAVATAAVATAAVATHGFGSRGTRGAAASDKSQSTLLLPHAWWHAPRQVSTPAGATASRPSATKRVERPRARSKPVRQTILVANTEPATSIPPAAPSSTSAGAASPSNGATPLPAPTASSGAPRPLKAPKR